MIKRILSIFLVGILSIGLVACGGENKKEETKTENTKQETKQEEKQDEKKDDVWTYFENSKWEDDYEGLKTEIEKVVVTDKAIGSDGKGNTSSAVGIKMKVTNTTKEKFTTYPDQAVLVTSTGEQIQTPNLWASDHLGGEIDEGVTKEGDIIWYLKKDGTAKDIEWIKLSWRSHKGADDKFDSKAKEYEIKLQLEN
ncbi:hypothetical protein [Clostridium frigidicarnis]|uniref:DUF4352 domain-containing protein n=1 Tax=Clostridium frigidicarnis TaxID=84698 RepID=A0A1I0V1A1_9CLOT|nr:hypothetical protein [Clostridium frigidicarnis]SFA69913.1 hypothetical protein SAMN04488528_100173 [Clostridium frigidicarnis]